VQQGKGEANRGGDGSEEARRRAAEGETDDRVNRQQDINNEHGNRNTTQNHNASRS
jgi:hypothetical protein